MTGEREASSGHPRRLAARIRSLTEVPLVMGVGISSPEQATAVAPYADGVIVGSALVRRALRSPDPVEEVTDAARRLARALHSPPGPRCMLCMLQCILQWQVNVERRS